MSLQPKNQSFQNTNQGAGKTEPNVDFGTNLFTNFGITNTFSGSNRGGESLEAIYEAAVKMAQAANEGTEGITYHVIKLLKGNYDVHYSSVILCAKIGNIVKHHILMLESTGRPLHPTQVDLGGGKSIPIPYLPSQVMNKDYMSVVESLVAATLKVPKDNVFDTDGTLVPNEFVVVDTNSAERLEKFLSEAFVAVLTGVVAATQGFVGYNINSMLTSSKGNFCIDVDFCGSDAMWSNSVDMPIRRDIIIDLSYKHAGHKNRVNSGEAIQDLVRIFGYVNAEKLPDRRRRRRDEDDYCFAPNFIITGMQAPGKTAMTEHLAMMGIASIITISEDRSWMRSFLGRPSGKGKINMNDPAFLNIEGRVLAKDGNYGDPMPLHGPGKASQEERLDQFFQTIMDPRLVISMDVPEASPDTWYMSIFRDIKDGDPYAIARMRDVITTLLNGRFDKDNIPMFASISNDVHGGYYKESNGQMVDIRKADSYLGVAQYAFERKDPGILKDYVDTYVYDRPGSEIRAYDRMKIIEAVTNGGVVVKQYYKRITFTGAFIDNFVSQLRDVGFRPYNNSAGQSNNYFSGGGYDYAQDGIGYGTRITEERRSSYNSHYQPYSRRYSGSQDRR